MFEDFSFSSPSSTRPPRLAFDGDDRLMIDGDSSMISPLSSRCPSPKTTSSHKFSRSLHRSRSSHFRSPQPPTSVPFSAYDGKRLSISTLTRKLHEHTIQSQSQEEKPDDVPTSPSTPRSVPDMGSTSGQFQGYFLTPPDTDHDDEGYCDSASMTSLSPSLSPHQQSPFLGALAAPLDLTSQGGALDSLLNSGLDATMNIRAHRQHISRLQCNPSDIEAIRRALISEDEPSEFGPSNEDDCHPSSLPPQLSPRRRAVTLSRSRYRPITATSGLSDTSGGEHRDRRKSTAGVPSSHRIEKSYCLSSSRDYRKKSDQGLRRKSLVSAALASVVDKAPLST
ncbi:hypothetical protein KXX25_003434 [Aspergillus fumigatus]|nr:hypothetical protein KXX23_003019 [Aspergillus fumigatus]KAH1725372.1 hypothetical protein KXX40_000562 [Aspergillus fumigatus]KAH1734513.1 hypothetical protein KXX25_003434 [Aspergillus fumigatus]KAH2092025.1 hypothetical protein KXW86_005773 [Aspergillus fumigatus]KAH2159105.1 hypothetical protein KXW33_005768 [Aspergillus fumigatus]